MICADTIEIEVSTLNCLVIWICNPTAQVHVKVLGMKPPTPLEEQTDRIALYREASTHKGTVEHRVDEYALCIGLLSSKSTLHRIPIYDIYVTHHRFERIFVI